jgi:putative salt-induced outer membrane protein
MNLDSGAAGLGSSSHGQTTAENYSAYEKISFNVSDKDYFFERYRWDKDRFAGIIQRHDATAGAGRHLLATKDDSLIAEFSLGYTNAERPTPPRDSFATGRAYAKYSHTFTPSTSISQDAEYIANLEKDSGYRLAAETALTAALSTHLSFKSTFNWKRNGNPPPGTVKDDTLLGVALIVSY